jgi:hypothetical protein
MPASVGSIFRRFSIKLVIDTLRLGMGMVGYVGRKIGIL